MFDPYDLLGNAEPSKVVTEADFNLTVDFDSELEDSLGPDYLGHCIGSWDSDYDAEAVENIKDRDYKDLEDDFDEYTNEGLYQWQSHGIEPMKEYLYNNGLEEFLREYVIRRKFSVQKLLFGFGVILSPERREQSDVELLPLLKAAAFRSIRRRRPLALNARIPPLGGSFDDLIQRIKDCKNIIVLTGAGISVSCGIPDFRSRNGLYSQLFSSGIYDLDDPQQMFDINYFKHNPSVFYSFAHKIYPSNFSPSPCHRFIRAMEKEGKLLRNYTQNIDTLETKAGITRVLRCHGSFATASCVNCLKKVPGEEIKDDLLAQRIPICKVCNPEGEQKPKKVRRKKKKKKRTDGWESDEPEVIMPPLPAGIMKPDITFFGEKLSSKFDKKYFEDIKSVDLLLVIGTSLKVRPVSEIASHLPHKVPIVVINKTPLTHIRPDFQLLGDADVIVEYLAHKFGWDIRPQDSGFYGQNLLMKRKKPSFRRRVLGESGVVLFEGAEGGKFVDKLIEGKPANWGWEDSESSESEPEILMPPTVVKRPRTMLAQGSITRRPAALRA